MYDRLKDLIQNYNDINDVKKYFDTYGNARLDIALKMAVESNSNSELINCLIGLGAKLELKDALKKGYNEEAIEAILYKGGELYDDVLKDALHYKASSKTMGLLINNKAKIYSTILQDAIYHKAKKEIFELLLKNKNLLYDSILKDAIREDVSKEIFELLIDSGANTNYTWVKKEEVACSEPITVKKKISVNKISDKKVIDTTYDLVSYAKEQKIDPEKIALILAKSNGGLRYALKEKYDENVVKTLFEHGGKIYDDVLKDAIQNNVNNKIIKLLIEKKAPKYKNILKDAIDYNLPKEILELLTGPKTDVNNVITQNGTDYTPLMYFLYQGKTDEKIFKLLIEITADVNDEWTEFENIYTPLKYALEKRFPLDIIGLLIDRGAKIYDTVLEDAIKNHANENVIGLLIDRGAKIYDTALKDAIKNHANENVLGMLVDNGADPNWKWEGRLNGCTPLFYFIQQPNPNKEIIKKLLEHGANANYVWINNDINYIPLSYLLQQPNPNPELIELLLEHGADVNYQWHTNLENTPLLYLLRQTNPDETLVELLLEYGANVNHMFFDTKQNWRYETDKPNKRICVTKFIKYKTLLEYAIKNRVKLDIINLLFSFSKNNVNDLLKYAIENDADSAVFHFLIANGANVNYQWQENREILNLLLCAIRAGKDERIIKLLLDNGATYLGFKEFAVKDAIKVNTSRGVLKLLLDKGARLYNSILKDAISNGVNQEVIKLLLDRKVELYDSVLKDLLYHYYEREIITLFIEYGANINYHWRDRRNYTPLTYLLMQDQPDENLIEFLIRSGADVNYEIKIDLLTKYSPMTYTLKYRKKFSEKLILLLIEKSDIVNLKDRGRNISPLKYVLTHRFNSKKIVEALLVRGEKLYDDVLVDAIDNGTNEEIIEVLLNNHAKTSSLGKITLESALKKKNGIKTIKLLINNGIKLYDSVLKDAIEEDVSEEVIRLLIEKKANIKYQDAAGDTLLLIAAKHNSPKSIIKLFLDAGVNPYTENKKGQNFQDLGISI